MDVYLRLLEEVFRENANLKIAAQQKAYMRGRFEFYGIKTPDRRAICLPFLSKKDLTDKKEAVACARALWLKPERENQYFAQELIYAYRKTPEATDIDLFEWMVVNKSWWDTVDFIAADLIGGYFRAFPDRRDKYVEKWLASGHIWLQRSAILFQLKYKEKTDMALLERLILSLAGSKEFFINKAIGWALREYGKTNPEWVSAFAERTPLSVLSRKEGLRRIKKQADDLL